MSHPDTCWRMAAIYRCCVRRNMPLTWAIAQVNAMPIMFKHERESLKRCVEIWFRNHAMTRRREEWRSQ